MNKKEHHERHVSQCSIDYTNEITYAAQQRNVKNPKSLSTNKYIKETQNEKNKSSKTSLHFAGDGVNV